MSDHDEPTKVVLWRKRWRNPSSVKAHENKRNELINENRNNGRTQLLAAETIHQKKKNEALKRYI